jgi:hypothetical protein
MKLARHVGRRRRVVDEHRALLHAVERPALADCHLAHVGVIADAGEDEIGVPGGVGRRRRALAAELVRPGLRLVGAAVEHGDVVPAALGQMAGHRIAHHAKPDPRCSLAHCLASFVCCNRLTMSLAASRATIPCDGHWR